ncbi:MAG: methylated-DNA--[protein]-cysteine S-methyltransferase [Flavobacteriaceae bacterium]|nr:methylated-DNA--[protein]-cysteine S-methyltransferase [Flavobacteriaceae bacterium]
MNNTDYSKLNIKDIVMGYKETYRPKINITENTKEEFSKNIEKINYSFYTTIIGDITIASSPKGVCYLVFSQEGNKDLEEMNKLFPKAIFSLKKDDNQQKILDYIAGKHIEYIKIHLVGTKFQLSVWRELLNINPNGFTSYGKLAEDINRVKALRAVGTAVGKNPISVILPCHRVLPKNGNIGNYRWGAEKKIEIIKLGF